MIFLLFFLGLMIGSFLNVVLSRLDTDESFVTGRSRCDECGALVRWYDNIPVLSLLFLRGRCRSCGRPISVRHIAVEVSTAVLFSAVGAFFPYPDTVSGVADIALALGLIASLTVVFVHDLARMEIPVSALVFGMVWSIAMLAVVWLAGDSSVRFFDSRLFEGVVGGGIAFALFYALVRFSGETWMGAGDAWLALVLGLVVGWRLLLPTLTIAFGTGAIVGIVLMVSGRKGLKSQLPFAPFLVASVIFMLFFGTMVQELFVGLM
ncbi:MAG: prepilin peptidase [Candidatus Moranbacteria bacterium]|nr:prepilin peptidase [Candidatus Moranbacteria bacterium]